MGRGCAICESGSGLSHGCVSSSNIYTPKPKGFPLRLPISPRVFTEPVPLIPRTGGSISYYPAGSIGGYPVVPTIEKIEANVDGVYIKIPKTKAGITLARDVLKLLEKQIE